MNQTYINDIKHQLDQLAFDNFESDNKASTRQLTPLMLLAMYYLVSYGHCQFRWAKSHKEYPKYLKILLILGFVSIKAKKTKANGTNANELTTCKTCYPTKLGKSYFKYALNKNCQPTKSIQPTNWDLITSFTIPDIIMAVSIISLSALMASVLIIGIPLIDAIIWSAMTLLGITISMVCIGYSKNHDDLNGLANGINDIVRDNKRGNIAEPRSMKDHFNYRKFLKEALYTGNISEGSLITFMIRNNVMISHIDQLSDLINFTMFADYSHPLELLGNNITMNDLQNYSIIRKNQ